MPAHHLEHIEPSVASLIAMHDTVFPSHKAERKRAPRTRPSRDGFLFSRCWNRQVALALASRFGPATTFGPFFKVGNRPPARPSFPRDIRGADTRDGLSVLWSESCASAGRGGETLHGFPLSPWQQDSRRRRRNVSLERSRADRRRRRLCSNALIWERVASGRAACHAYVVLSSICVRASGGVRASSLANGSSLAHR